jgi:zinc protease
LRNNAIPHLSRALRLAAGLWLAALATLAHATLPIEHWTTPQGTRVYFVRADAIPMLDVNVDVDAGSRWDPRERAGLAAMTAGLLARGVPGMDENAIAERFAELGARRGGGAGDDRASHSLRTLTSARELEGSLAMFERLLREPVFPAEVLARQKEQIVQGLREAQTKPDYIANRTFGETIYPQHPYGLSESPETVAAIDRAQIEAFWRANYAAGRAVISMIGAIPRAEAERIAERLSSALPRGEAAPALPAVSLDGAGRTLRIAHPASQSHILIGAPAIARDDPDFFPLLVGNYILGGGGFVSRLTSEVREKRGLAYSVYSYFSPAAQAGPFQIGLQTAKDQTDTALSVVRDTLERFLRDGPTDAELKAAKDNLVGGFPLRIDSNRKILDNLANIGWYRLPLDYLDTWTRSVQKVGVADIRAAFSRHVQPARLSTVVVGAGS